jgi:hypothetical protein
MPDRVLYQRRTGYQVVVQLHVEDRRLVVLNVTRELAPVGSIYGAETAASFDVPCGSLLGDLIQLHPVLLGDDVGGTEDKGARFAGHGSSDRDPLRPGETTKVSGTLRRQMTFRDSPPRHNEPIVPFDPKDVALAKPRCECPVFASMCGCSSVVKRHRFSTSRNITRSRFDLLFQERLEMLPTVQTTDPADTRIDAVHDGTGYKRRTTRPSINHPRLEHFNGKATTDLRYPREELFRSDSA